jgi:hypothetical protein
MVPLSDERTTGPRLALLFLCHEAPRVVARRLSQPFFSHPDVKVYIHYDATRRGAQHDELARQIPAGVRHIFVAEPVACRWGEFSLVDATHRLMELALADTGFAAEHLILLSASCVPIRPVSSLQAFVRARPGIEFIQAHDIREGRWVQDGLESERYQYYYPFNYRTHRGWFEWATARQREFGIRRAMPAGVDVHFGSQWFCLTRATAAVVASGLRRPDWRRWLRWSWIPDEFAIQTLVAQQGPRAAIAGHNLTYYEFDPQGQPLILDNGHLEHLLAQPFFFARKLAPEAVALAQALEERTTRAEADLSYFERAGIPTADYARFLARVGTGALPRAHIGTVEDAWRGPMDSNRRRYYVLHATSRAWLLALLRAARADSRLPIFDLPFDASAALIAGAGAHRGFAPGDRFRRDHDPSAYLLELVNVEPGQPAAFGLDVRPSGWVRDFVKWDSRATLIDCDPPLSREQRAASLLAELDRAVDAPAIQQTLAAMRDGSPLPDDRFLAELSAKRNCQLAAMRDLGPGLGDATLVALRSAYHALDPAFCHPAPGAAWHQFWT